MTISGTITGIQRFSLDDGPGIRTTVFLKGCNLKCLWCHNPETIESTPQLIYNEALCIGCGACKQACKRNLHDIVPDGHKFERSNCETCFACISVCPVNALECSGKKIEPEELLKVILKDKSFYQISGGGVTFSGGEPFLHPDFLPVMLKKCVENGLHTCVDTAANIHWSLIESVMDDVNIFLVDCKLISQELHEKATGVKNQRILENIKRLGETGKEIWIRIPIVPGFQDRDKEIQKFSDFLCSVSGIARIELLPYHRYGEGKYKLLGMEYGLPDASVPNDESIASIKEILFV